MAWPKGVPRKKVECPGVARNLDGSPVHNMCCSKHDPEFDPEKNVLTELLTLKLKAETALDSRGHELGDWRNDLLASRAACTRCLGVVTVREKDAKKGIFHCDEKASGTCA